MNEGEPKAAMLCVEELSKAFTAKNRREREQVHAVDGVSFEVAEGEMFTLLGPSGCGKTTTLRVIAGLENADAGLVRVNGKTLFERRGGRSTNVPINRRSLGMVFQSYAIWPHMKVFDNVAFPLVVTGRRRRLSRSEIRQRVMTVLERMELDNLEQRPATHLSGGQQQRLALARAIVTEPALLLLDEPLSNLDAKLRESLRFELKRLQSELGVTSIYVTHDQVEALSLSSRIAVMNAGRIEQLGTPTDVYERPKSSFVAEFIGSSNLLRGRVSAVSSTGITVDTPVGPIDATTAATLQTGDLVLVSARPETIGVTAAEPSEARNMLKGRVLTRAYLGELVDYVVDVGGATVRVRSNPGLVVPDDVYLVLDRDRLAVVPL